MSTPTPRMTRYGSLKIFMQNSEKYSKVDLRQTKFRIGSDIQCEIKLTRLNVEPIHCEISIALDGLAILKNNSKKNPVTINGKEVPQHTYLIPDDEFDIVGKRFRYENTNILPVIVERAKKKNLERIRQMKRTTTAGLSRTPQPSKQEKPNVRRSKSLDVGEKSGSKIPLPKQRPQVLGTDRMSRTSWLESLNPSKASTTRCSNGFDITTPCKNDLQPDQKSAEEQADVSTPIDKTSMIAIADASDEKTPLRSRKTKTKEISIQRLTQNDDSIVVLDTPDSKTPKSALKTGSTSTCSMKKSKLLKEFSELEEEETSNLASSVITIDDGSEHQEDTEDESAIEPTNKFESNSFVAESGHESDVPSKPALEVAKKVNFDVFDSPGCEFNIKTPLCSTPGPGRAGKRLEESFKESEDKPSEESEYFEDLDSSDSNVLTGHKRKRVSSSANSDELSLKRIKETVETTLAEMTSFNSQDFFSDNEKELSVLQEYEDKLQIAKSPVANVTDRKAMTEPRKDKQRKMLTRRSLSVRQSDQQEHDQENQPIMEVSNTTLESVDTSSFVYVKNNITFENTEFPATPEDKGKKSRKEPLNDLTDVSGVKQVMRQHEPLNDLSSPKGIKELMKTPKVSNEVAIDEEASEYESNQSVFNVSGIDKLPDEDEVFGVRKTLRNYGKSLPANAKIEKPSRKSLRNVDVNPHVAAWVDETVKASEGPSRTTDNTDIDEDLLFGDLDSEGTEEVVKSLKKSGRQSLKAETEQVVLAPRKSVRKSSKETVDVNSEEVEIAAETENEATQQEREDSPSDVDDIAAQLEETLEETKTEFTYAKKATRQSVNVALTEDEQRFVVSSARRSSRKLSKPVSIDEDHNLDKTTKKLAMYSSKAGLNEETSNELDKPVVETVSAEVQDDAHYLVNESEVFEDFLTEAAAASSARKSTRKSTKTVPVDEVKEKLAARKSVRKSVKKPIEDEDVESDGSQHKNSESIDDLDDSVFERATPDVSRRKSTRKSSKVSSLDENPIEIEKSAKETSSKTWEIEQTEDSLTGGDDEYQDEIAEENDGSIVAHQDSAFEEQLAEMTSARKSIRKSTKRSSIDVNVPVTEKSTKNKSGKIDETKVELLPRKSFRKSIKIQPPNEELETSAAQDESQDEIVEENDESFEVQEDSIIEEPIPEDEDFDEPLNQKSAKKESRKSLKSELTEENSTEANELKEELLGRKSIRKSVKTQPENEEVQTVLSAVEDDIVEEKDEFIVAQEDAVIEEPLPEVKSSRRNTRKSMRLSSVNEDEPVTEKVATKSRKLSKLEQTEESFTEVDQPAETLPARKSIRKSSIAVPDDIVQENDESIAALEDSVLEELLPEVASSRKSSRTSAKSSVDEGEIVTEKSTKNKSRKPSKLEQTEENLTEVDEPVRKSFRKSVKAQLENDEVQTISSAIQDEVQDEIAEENDKSFVVQEDSLSEEPMPKVSSTRKSTRKSTKSASVDEDVPEKRTAKKKPRKSLKSEQTDDNSTEVDEPKEQPENEEVQTISSAVGDESQDEIDKENDESIVAHEDSVIEEPISEVASSRKSTRKSTKPTLVDKDEPVIEKSVKKKPRKSLKSEQTEDNSTEVDELNEELSQPENKEVRTGSSAVGDESQDEIAKENDESIAAQEDSVIEEPIPEVTSSRKSTRKSTKLSSLDKDVTEKSAKKKPRKSLKLEQMEDNPSEVDDPKEELAQPENEEFKSVSSAIQDETEDEIAEENDESIETLEDLVLEELITEEKSSRNGTRTSTKSPVDDDVPEKTPKKKSMPSLKPEQTVDNSTDEEKSLGAESITEDVFSSSDDQNITSDVEPSEPVPEAVQDKSQHEIVEKYDESIVASRKSARKSAKPASVDETEPETKSSTKKKPRKSIKSDETAEDATEVAELPRKSFRKSGKQLETELEDSLEVIDDSVIDEPTAEETASSRKSMRKSVKKQVSNEDVELCPAVEATTGDENEHENIESDDDLDDLVFEEQSPEAEVLSSRKSVRKSTKSESVDKSAKKKSRKSLKSPQTKENSTEVSVQNESQHEIDVSMEALVLEDSMTEEPTPEPAILSSRKSVSTNSESVDPDVSLAKKSKQTPRTSLKLTQMEEALTETDESIEDIALEDSVIEETTPAVTSSKKSARNSAIATSVDETETEQSTKKTRKSLKFEGNQESSTEVPELNEEDAVIEPSPELSFSTKNNRKSRKSLKSQQSEETSTVEDTEEKSQQDNDQSIGLLDDSETEASSSRGSVRKWLKSTPISENKTNSAKKNSRKSRKSEQEGSSTEHNEPRKPSETEKVEIANATDENLESVVKPVKKRGKKLLAPSAIEQTTERRSARNRKQIEMVDLTQGESSSTKRTAKQAAIPKLVEKRGRPNSAIDSETETDEEHVETSTKKKRQLRTPSNIKGTPVTTSEDTYITPAKEPPHRDDVLFKTPQALPKSAKVVEEEKAQVPKKKQRKQSESESDNVEGVSELASTPQALPKEQPTKSLPRAMRTRRQATIEKEDLPVEPEVTPASKPRRGTRTRKETLSGNIVTSQPNSAQTRTRRGRRATEDEPTVEPEVESIKVTPKPKQTKQRKGKLAKSEQEVEQESPKQEQLTSAKKTRGRTARAGKKSESEVVQASETSEHEKPVELEARKVKVETPKPRPRRNVNKAEAKSPAEETMSPEVLQESKKTLKGRRGNKLTSESVVVAVDEILAEVSAKTKKTSKQSESETEKKPTKRPTRALRGRKAVAEPEFPIQVDSDSETSAEEIIEPKPRRKGKKANVEPEIPVEVQLVPEMVSPESPPKPKTKRATKRKVAEPEPESKSQEVNDEPVKKQSRAKKVVPPKKAPEVVEVEHVITRTTIAKGVKVNTISVRKVTFDENSVDNPAVLDTPAGKPKGKRRLQSEDELNMAAQEAPSLRRSARTRK